MSGDQQERVEKANLAVRPSRTREAGTSGDADAPVRWLSSPGTSVTTSRMPRASASRVSAVVEVMLLGTSRGRFWVLYVALIAESSGGVLYMPALQARTPAIVGTGTLLSSANSLNAFTGGVVQLIGGPLGGILLALYGIKWLICADAVSYLLSAAAIPVTVIFLAANASLNGSVDERVGDVAPVEEHRGYSLSL